jgi:hypothetical protein
VRGCSYTPNHQTGVLPLVDCPHLRIQHISDHTPFLEAVFSIGKLRMRHRDDAAADDDYIIKKKTVLGNYRVV